MPKQELVSLIITILGVGIFAVLFVFLYSKFVKIQVSEVFSGKEDSVLLTNILKKDEEKLKKNQKHNKIIKWVVYAVLLVIIVPFLIMSIISIKNNGVVMIGGRSIMVVASGSMSYKNEVNDYLIENNLNDQFDTYDIIVIKQVNDASELELYDTVAYYNGTENIIHRIVNINENETYITRGDANTSSDPVLVEFDDIIGVYTGTHIKGIGIFVLFLQSPAGLATIICLLFCLFIIDYFSNKVIKAQNERMQTLNSLVNGNGLEYNKEDIKTILYYKGIEYDFSKESYLGKCQIEDEALNEESLKKVIKKNLKK